MKIEVICCLFFEPCLYSVALFLLLLMLSALIVIKCVNAVISVIEAFFRQLVKFIMFHGKVNRAVGTAVSTRVPFKTQYTRFIITASELTIQALLVMAPRSKSSSVYNFVNNCICCTELKAWDRCPVP